MLIAGFLLFSTSLLNVKPSPVIASVTVGGHGPYRFLVDTGSQTSFIDAKLAAQLKLVPRFRVEIVTQNSTRVAPALKLDTLRIGEHALPETEVVFHDLVAPRRLDPLVQGVLGLNALAGLNFGLSPGGELELGAVRPPGEAVAFRRIEERIAIPARMGGETLTLILDSGATHFVLFRRPAAMAKSTSIAATFATIEGARTTAPTSWTADMTFTKAVHLAMKPAAIVNRPGTAVDGLLPASVFRKIYVDQDRGEVVLVP